MNTGGAGLLWKAKQLTKEEREWYQSGSPEQM